MNEVDAVVEQDSWNIMRGLFDEETGGVGRRWGFGIKRFK